MRVVRILPLAALALVSWSVAAGSQSSTERSVAASGQQPSPQQQTQQPPLTTYEGTFKTDVLAGGDINELIVPVPLLQLHGYPSGTIIWKRETTWGSDFCKPGPMAALKNGEALSQPVSISTYPKKPVKDRSDLTAVGVPIPPAPCWWPLKQTAQLRITGQIGLEPSRTTEKPLFDGTVEVAVLWFPLLLTMLMIALIYPGCAMAAWYVSQRRYRKAVDGAKKSDDPPPKPPAGFLASLDPVQMTRNSYGRASLSKLQVFLFTLIVFGLLFFNVVRTGVLANMSTDVLLLLGISAVGAAGGKIAYVARRRLSLENWAWLRRRKWLPPEGDVAPRARWSELFLDADTKEFDPYSFQMAIFSLVVAVALIRTSLGGLETFQIPGELLALLGISQAVFIGGRAIEKSGHAELDTKLKEVREHESKYQELQTRVDAAAQLAKTEDKEKPAAPAAEAKVELRAFRTSAAQAAEMFWAIYGEQLGKMPPAIANVDKIEPDMPPAVPTA